MPQFTLVVNTDGLNGTQSDKQLSFVKAIKKSLDVDLQILPEKNQKLNGKLIYSLTGYSVDQQVKSLQKCGVKMITYSAEAKNYIDGTRAAAISDAHK